MFHTEVVEIKTHTLHVSKSCSLQDNADKNGRTRQAIDDIMVHVHCVLDNKGYRHILGICNTSCFAMATMVKWMCLIVTQYR
jgi:predicted DNA-binding protein YlxM (UPF0122 family)